MSIAELDLARSVADVAELARHRAGDVERERQLTDDLVQAIRVSGINRMYLPASLGGVPATLRDTVDVLSTVSEADGSTGWCAAIGSGSKFFSGYVSEAAAAEILADPDDAFASMFGPMGTAVATGSGDGYVLDGRWPFTSNCLHSSWLGLAAWFSAGDGSDPEPAPRLVFVPREAVEVHDTWDVAGLRGTGSHDTAVAGLEIRRSYSCAFHEPPWADDTMWRLPLFTVLVPTLAAVFLGVARGAIDEVLRDVDGGRAAMRGRLTDDSVSSADLAGADASLRAARAGLDVALDEAWDLAERRIAIAQPLQARIYMACHHAVEISVAVTATAHRLGGSAAAYSSHPLRRALADVQTARQHIAFHHGNRSLFGQALAGVKVFAPPFFY